MKTQCLFLIIIVGFKINCSAQDNNYAVNLIPPELLKNANAVKRIDETKITINDIGKASIHHKYAITILNEGGDENAEFEAGYDQFIIIKDVEGKLFDAGGKKIRSMKKDELKDISNASDNLIDDDRVKLHDFDDKVYPYTVEYEWETEFKGIFYLPEWTPVEHEKLSVQSSQLVVQCPGDYQLRYKIFNYNREPEITRLNNNKIYSWSIEKVLAITDQQYQPEWYELTPTVFLAPADFEMQEYKGNMNTWKGFGNFVYSLNKGRDELPDNIKQLVHLLTDGLKDDHEKIKVLYQYLQKNTRYVSIQLGIGGWQTFDARYVATKGYGDCKALSNYMYSLLKEARIKSYYTLIKAGEYNTDFLGDFPSTQFNHIIVCVPLKKDTMWLECTSNILPAGYLSSFTCNRNALLIDENGGTLVHTPDYKMNDNLQIRKIIANIDSTGFLQAKSNTEYTGLQQDDLDEMLNGLSKDKVMEYLKQHIDLPSYDVTRFDYKEDKNILPDVNEMLEITSNNYAAVSGKRFFVTPNILNRHQTKLKDVDQRTCDIILRAEYKDVDSIEISIPADYKAESTPDNINLASKFGNYTSSIKILPGKIMYYRTMECNSGRFPASDAKLLATFFDKIYKADRSKVVLIKND
jgi:hypothetical protein